MKLSQYGYEFKPEMLAKYPAENRDEARLMVVNRAKGTIEHRIFKDIIDYFDEGDLFVFNDTKVFPARLYGNKEKTGAEIEIFLLRELNRELRLWDVLVDPARKIRIGNKLYFGDDDLMVAEVIDNTTSRGRTLRFLFDGDYDEFKTALFKLGETPLPRWVREKVEPEDSERYRVYQEFLSFYADTKINFITFTREGSYEKLYKLMGKTPGKKWSPEDLFDFQSCFYRFQQAYNAKAEGSAPMPACDALLIYLEVFGYEDSVEKTPAEFGQEIERICDEKLEEYYRRFG